MIPIHCRQTADLRCCMANISITEENNSNVYLSQDIIHLWNWRTRGVIRTYLGRQTQRRESASRDVPWDESNIAGTIQWWQIYRSLKLTINDNLLKMETC